MSDVRVEVTYNGDEDILHVSLREDHWVRSTEGPDDGFVRHYCARTGDVVGYTVLDFQHYWAHGRWEQLREIMSVFVGNITTFREVLRQVDELFAAREEATS